MTLDPVFTSNPPKVLILGGGVAGIAAAVEAAERGLDVTLVERKPTLGGRAYSFEDPTSGRELDNGQHVLIAGYANFRRLLEQLGSARHVHFQPRLNIRYLEADGRSFGLEASALPGPLHLGGGLLKFGRFSWREKLSMIRPSLSLLVAGAGLDSDICARAEESTLSKLLDTFKQSDNVREVFWESLSLATLNGSLNEVSAMSMGRILHAGFAAKATSAPLGFPTTGLSDLIGKPAKERLQRLGVQLRLSTSVTGLTLLEGGQWSVDLGRGEVLVAKHVISALEPHVLGKLLTPNLENRAIPELGGHLNALDRIDYSPIVSAHALYSYPLRLPKTFVALLGSELQWVFDAGQIQGASPDAPGHLSLTISGADRLSVMPKAELHQFLADELKRFFPKLHRDDAPPRIVSIKEKRATILPSPDVEAARPGTLLPGLPNLYLAGAWTRTGFPSTLEGAAISGYRAIEALLETLGHSAGIARALDGRDFPMRWLETLCRALSKRGLLARFL